MAEGRDPKNMRPDDAQPPSGDEQRPVDGWHKPDASEQSPSPEAPGG